MRRFITGETVSCRNGDLSTCHKMAQVGQASRDHGKWHACQEGFTGSTKGRLSAGLPLASGLVPGVVTRSGR
jgi:hypothetical protein